MSTVTRLNRGHKKEQGSIVIRDAKMQRTIDAKRIREAEKQALDELMATPTYKKYIAILGRVKTYEENKPEPRVEPDEGSV